MRKRAWLGLMLVVACIAPALGQEPRRAILPEQRRMMVRPPAGMRPAPLPRIATPPTVRAPLPEKALRPISLDEAIRIGLANAEVIRVLGGFSASSSGSTIYDPAINNTLIDQNRATFDPTARSRNVFSQTDIPTGTIVNPGPPAQAAIVGDPIDGFSSTNGVSKRFLTGATAGVDVNVNNNFFHAPGLPLNPSTSSNTFLSLTQPILRGFGYQANAAPILVARLDTERSFFQLKDSVQELVRGVVEGYWQLVFAETDLWAREQQVAQGLEALRRAEARLESGLGNDAEVAQAQVSYESFRAQLVSSRAGLLQREAALRNLLGMPPVDGLRLTPSTRPRISRLPIDWGRLVEVAEVNRPDLIELKLILEADEQQIVLANNTALPALDAIAQYRWNGLEGRTPDLQRINDQGRFSDWQLGVNFSVPLGLRRERAQVRQRELLLMRDRANLRQALHQTTHSLAGNMRNLDQFYEQYLAFRRLRTAARINLERQLADFLSGRRTLYLNVLQAITDWGNAVSNETQSLVQYNTELATLERQSGIILELHGVRFVEERYGAVGPLGRGFAPQWYPRDMRPTENSERAIAPEKELWQRPARQSLPDEVEPIELPPTDEELIPPPNGDLSPDPLPPGATDPNALPPGSADPQPGIPENRRDPLTRPSATRPGPRLSPKPSARPVSSRRKG